MLEAHGIPFRYREYRKEPLSVDEIQTICSLLDASPHDLLRRNDAAYKALGLDGGEHDLRLIDLMAANPTLLQRPIGIHRRRAVLARPPERLLDLLDAP